ncbi:MULTISPECIES: alanine dehydrogenase [unclassified Marinimicrobium]|jgi:alanine dehydrogenase|uniref:alanine dehydrogenase n=1 Tax=unclassified Marinimicrobium TaxID=2632100 RepID=UPI00257A5D09|nr:MULTISPECIES: alanine dehydrogenase [unclassified Marinimicrobium]
MRIGVPREIKTDEYRVGLTPSAVRELAGQGHSVLVEQEAGAAVGLDDASYEAAGATLVDSASAVFAQAELIVKVKEPQPEEYRQLNPDQILFTFLHLAPDPEQAEGLLASGASCIAYETVTDQAGRLPLLTPMSEVAGRLATQAGAHHLELHQGGRGILLGGVPGVPPAGVTIIGGGVVGTQAARMALGLGAQVRILDKSLVRLRELDALFHGRLVCEYATENALEQALPQTDLLIGAVLVAGDSAPKLLSREQLGALPKGAVLVDVAIDQGGCFATSRPTTHRQPTFSLDGVVHYCVANIPSAAARTATLALSHATLPYVQALAQNGLEALKRDPGLRAGLNVHRGQITHEAVARALGKPWVAFGGGPE